MSEVLYKPKRGHQCTHLGRWVTSQDDPYLVPEDLVRRYLRHNLGTVVGGVDMAEGQDESVLVEVTKDPEDMTKAELAEVLGLGSYGNISKQELLDRFHTEAEGSAYHEEEAS